MKLSRFAALSLAIFGLAAICHAQLYQVTLTGTVSQITGSYWDSSVALGTPMSMSFTFDASAPVSSATATEGYYNFTDLSATIEVGNYWASVSRDQVIVLNDTSEAYNGPDGYSMSGYLDVATQTNIDLYFLTFRAILTSQSTSLLSNIEQPVQQFDISEFISPSFVVLGSSHSNETNFLLGDVTSYTVSAVPEPSTYALIAGAVMGAAALVARRRKLARA